MGGHGLGKAFIHPAPLLQGSFHGAGTGLKTLSGQIIDQRTGAPTGFEIAILNRLPGQHGLQGRQSLVLLAIRAARGRGVLEPLKALTKVGFEPATNRMLVTPDRLGNDGNALPPI